MIPKIKKILYATDLSENARFAFSYAASLADQYGAGITVLHVVELATATANLHVVSLLGEERWNAILRQNTQEILDTVKEKLDKFCEDMKAEDKTCRFIVDDIVVRQGYAVDEILSQAETVGYDVIVVGTHGHGILAGALMGSTARRVVRRSKTPVLVVRLPEEEDAQ
jgi:nucleotide-binding universal stress UspA family protein